MKEDNSNGKNGRKNFSGCIFSKRCNKKDEELHKNVKGDVKWEKGTQINRPDETAIKKWLDEVL